MSQKEIIAQLQKEQQERANLPKYLKIGQPIEIPLQVPTKTSETVKGQWGDYEKMTYHYVGVTDLMTNKVSNFDIPDWLHDQIQDQLKQKNYPEKIVFVRRK